MKGNEIGIITPEMEKRELLTKIEEVLKRYIKIELSNNSRDLSSLGKDIKPLEEEYKALLKKVEEIFPGLYEIMSKSDIGKIIQVKASNIEEMRKKFVSSLAESICNGVQSEVSKRVENYMKNEEKEIENIFNSIKNVVNDLRTITNYEPTNRTKKEKVIELIKKKMEEREYEAGATCNELKKIISPLYINSLEKRGVIVKSRVPGVNVGEEYNHQEFVTTYFIKPEIDKRLRRYLEYLGKSTGWNTVKEIAKEAGIEVTDGKLRVLKRNFHELEEKGFCKIRYIDIRTGKEIENPKRAVMQVKITKYGKIALKQN